MNPARPNAGRHESIENTSTHIIPPLCLWAESPHLWSAGGAGRFRPLSATGSGGTDTIDVRTKSDAAGEGAVPAPPTPESAKQPSWVQWETSSNSLRNKSQHGGMTDVSRCCTPKRFWVLQQPRVCLLLTLYCVYAVRLVGVLNGGIGITGVTVAGHYVPEGS